VQEFGPPGGRDNIVAGAGARSVFDPGGGVAFTSAADLESKIAANGAGTIFVAANNIAWDREVQLPSAKAPRVWIPGFRTLDGGNGTHQGIVVNGASELHGGNWINFGNASAPLFIGAVRTNGTGALVQDVTASFCYNLGIAMRGNDTVMDHCTVHHNGRYGFNGTQEVSGGPPSMRTRFQYSLIYNNNTNLNDPGGDAGGNKISGTQDYYVGFNYSHHNLGAGLWSDFANGDAVWESNVCELNSWWGIFHEMATGQVADGVQANANIHHNWLKDNCTGAGGVPSPNSWFNGVQLLSSCTDGLANGGDGYEVHHNYIDGTVRAAAWVAHDNHPENQRGCHFHDNDVWLRGSALGIMGGSWEDSSSPNHVIDPFAPSSNNTFVSNHYHVPVGGLALARWRLGTGVIGGHTNATWAQWQASGRDVGGTLEEIAA
jgi:hypothetical protein